MLNESPDYRTQEQYNREGEAKRLPFVFNHPAIDPNEPVEIRFDFFDNETVVVQNRKVHTVKSSDIHWM